ncbi:MAG: UrcA family protein [Gammaproteobacteria bacterium]
MSRSNPPSIARTLCTLSLPVVATLTTFAITSSPAHAGPQDDTPAVTVRYDDLNLLNTSGTKTLYHRLRTAANTVCPTADERQPERKMQSRLCYEKSLSAAVIDVNNPGLSALHFNRRGTVTTTVGTTARTDPAGRTRPVVVSALGIR